MRDFWHQEAGSRLSGSGASYKIVLGANLTLAIGPELESEAKMRKLAIVAKS